MSIPFKTASNFSLPVLGFGTWQMGGRYKRDVRNDDARDIRAIRYAVKSGLVHIDTAEFYAAGHAEELVGQAIRNFDRSQLFITTKVRPEHLKYDDVIQAAHDSLQRLGVKQIDLYLIHAYNRQIHLKETMKALAYLLENELIRYMGVSNFNQDLVAEAQSYTRYKIVNNQIHYNLKARAYEDNGTLEYCQKENILVTAYRLLDKGGFNKDNNQLLKELSAKYHKTPLQIALNWLIQQPNIVTIFKSSNLKHIDEDLGALGWRLSQTDLERLNRDYPRAETMHVPPY